MNKVERMTEIAKASPDFGKRVGYKMCVVDELHDIKELEKEAERFVSEKSDKGNFDIEQFGKAYFSESSMKQALVKFTEQRKVRTEIEINGVRFSSISDMLQYMDKLRDHIIDLEKENAELKRQVEQKQHLADVRLEQSLKSYKLFSDERKARIDADIALDNTTDRLTYAKTIIQDLLDNTDEYARQRAEDFLKEE